MDSVFEIYPILFGENWSQTFLLDKFLLEGENARLTLLDLACFGVNWFRLSLSDNYGIEVFVWCSST